MNKINSRAGLSLIELMLVSVIIGILVLTFGSMLYFAYRAWRQNQAAIELQQDAYAAMRKIAREVRHTQQGEITIISSTEINLDTNESLGIPSRNIGVDENGNLSFENSILIGADDINFIQFTDVDINEDGTPDGILQVGLDLANDLAAFGMTNLFLINERN